MTAEELMKEPQRVWINHPKSSYHGKSGLAFALSETDVRFYFFKGLFISMSIDPSHLSPGFHPDFTSADEPH